MYIPRSRNEVTNGGVSGVMWSNLGKVMEGKGRSESSEDAWRTSENVEWVLFGSSRNSIGVCLCLGPFLANT